MSKTAEKRPTKPIMTALGKVFAVEIEGATGGLYLPFQSGAKIYKQLVRDGLLRRTEVTLPGFLPVIVRGFALTPKGHYLYCANCEPEVK